MSPHVSEVIFRNLGVGSVSEYRVSHLNPFDGFKGDKVDVIPEGVVDFG